MPNRNTDNADHGTGESEEQQATYNVQLRVTNEKTGVSQVHDVLVTAPSQGAAESNAPDEILHDDDDSFEVIETTCFGVMGGDDA